MAAGYADGDLRILATRDQTPAIVRRLVEANVDVHRVASHQHSLEDIFLNMTREKDD